MAGGSGGFSIGDVADRTGLSVHALRFFEHEGLLLRPIVRTSGGHRVYDTSDVEWLELCNRLRDSGMPIATIKQFADLVRLGPGNEYERLALLQRHEQTVLAHLAELQSSLEVIRGKVAVYEQQLKDGTAEGLWAPVPQL